ncbi:hypothetical protein GD1_131 [Paraglaciecola Antarctic GD virus 1]|nr:hypothetical protein GD1_131 [Paraglaciecola Antarctic GD virus 1]
MTTTLIDFQTVTIQKIMDGTKDYNDAINVEIERVKSIEVQLNTIGSKFCTNLEVMTEAGYDMTVVPSYFLDKINIMVWNIIRSKGIKVNAYNTIISTLEYETEVLSYSRCQELREEIRANDDTV